MIEQTRFLSTVFLCSEFKLENFTLEEIFAGKMFEVINFYFRKFIFADSWKNHKN